MFLWTLAAALGRLSGLKIVLKVELFPFALSSLAPYVWQQSHLCGGQPTSCTRQADAEREVAHRALIL